MINLTTPGSYTRRENNVNVMTGVASTSVAGFTGVTVRGVVGKAQKITSWKQFEELYAKGNISSFSKGNLAYGVFMFFNNGGTECYISRVLGSGHKNATKMIPTLEGVTYTAKDPGVWGNSLVIDCVETEVSEVFTLTIKMNNEVVEIIKDLTAENFQEVVNKESSFVTVGSETLVAGTGALEGGTDGSIVANDYVKALDCFKVLDDVSICAIPGETGQGVQEGLLAFCGNCGDKIAVIESPSQTNIEEVLDYKSRLAEYSGAMYYPRVAINDPLTNELKYVGVAGALAGIYARTDSNVGVHKAPAGLDSVVRGALSVEKELTHEEIGQLNDSNINCIVPKRNDGIVVWGARLLKPNAERKFVSDLRLDLFIEKTCKELTEQFVFEPKDDLLFTRVNSVLNTFLKECWDKGMLLGASTEEAYFVRCDRDLNPDVLSETLNIEVGYAKKKPAEFVVTTLSHKQAY